MPAVRPGKRWALVLSLLLTLGLLVALLEDQAPDNDAFYEPPREVPSRPGALVRSEAYPRGAPAGARAWRLLYTTTREQGAPAVASAVVVAPAELPPGPRPVIAWAHGTTGIVPACAPSSLDSGFGAGIPALEQVIQRGWVLVATDYVGLGTEGPHPYLVGQGEARSVLDAVRAANEMSELTLARRSVLWGYSQGGHAALWAGILAPSYAGDSDVVGVAALAPATDLAPLISAMSDSPAGQVFGTLVVAAYSQVYPDVGFDEYVRPNLRGLARGIAGRCLAEGITPPSGESVFAANPASGALGRRLEQNTPDRPIASPLLIAQGRSDTLIPLAIQDRFVLRRCAAGQSLQYRTYAGRDHLSLIAPGSPLVGDLLRWTEARISGERVRPECTAVRR
jgi:Secretory lipase